MFSGYPITPAKLLLYRTLKKIKHDEEITREIKAVLKTLERLFDLSINLKNAVSNPYVKKTSKKATYAYSSVTTPYSSGIKHLVYKGTSK